MNLTEEQISKAKQKISENTLLLDNGCLIWMGSRHQGYGNLSLGKQFKAHRVSYFISKGEIPKGYGICHTCDNPSCINPDHLFAGTQKDNVIDAISKNRHHRSGSIYDIVDSQTSADRYIEIRISQDQLDWLDEMVDRDDEHQTCISTIIRDLIDKAKYQEDVYLEEYRKEQLEEQVRTRLVEDECQ